MALQNYITSADIHNGDFKQLPTATQDAYIDRVNDWYEAYADTKNVDTSLIAFPVNILVTEFLEQKLLMNFASDNLNGANTSTGGASKYQNIYIMNNGNTY